MGGREGGAGERRWAGSSGRRARRHACAATPGDAFDDVVRVNGRQMSRATTSIFGEDGGDDLFADDGEEDLVRGGPGCGRGRCRRS